MEDTMGPIPIVLYLKKSTISRDFLITYKTKKTTSVIMIMCLQIWMQLLIGFGPIVKECDFKRRRKENLYLQNVISKYVFLFWELCYLIV